MKQSQREQKRRPKPKDGTLLVCGVCGAAPRLLNLKVLLNSTTVNERLGNMTLYRVLLDVSESLDK
jgi:hypothetical protein